MVFERIVGGEISTFPDTLTTQGLSVWSLNIEWRGRDFGLPRHSVTLDFTIRLLRGYPYGLRTEHSDPDNCGMGESGYRAHAPRPSRQPYMYYVVESVIMTWHVTMTS